MIISIPNTSEWQPRADKIDTLQSAFLKRCINIEKRIQLSIQSEKEMNLNNYDSGVAIEELLKEELATILPKRYSIHSGIINDKDGRTAGDCDIIIFNDLWFPAIKEGITSKARRYHFPIEGVYAVFEVKQSLDIQTLDEAMRKLVICHRLRRSSTCANRMVENWDFDGCFHGLRNPLYSVIIAPSIKKGVEIDELVERFYYINKTLKRLEVIRCLCVLGKGALTWHFIDANGERRPALFMKEDLFTEIIPAYHKVPGIESVLFSMISDLSLHLYHSVLAAEDIPALYGIKDPRMKAPATKDIILEPDPEWLLKLKWAKDQDGNIIPIDECYKKGPI